MKRKLLVSIWRCGNKLHRSYTDGTVETQDVNASEDKSNNTMGDLKFTTAGEYMETFEHNL